MPIEIKELIIRATITSDTAKAKNRYDVKKDMQLNVDKSLIIDECVDQVMQIIKEKTER